MSLYSLKIPKRHRQCRKDSFLPGNIQKETPQCLYFTAGFTVEAAILLPLAACFFVSILFFFHVMQIQLCVQRALDDTGRKLAVYSADEATTLDLVAAKALFLKELGDVVSTEKYILGGKLGISLMKSEFDERDICIRADFKIRLPIQIFWTRDFTIEQHADCRRWNGYCPVGGETAGEQWVYVTETGNVYHCTKSCSHLELSIRSVYLAQISQLRSENGAKYYRCGQCGDRDSAGEIVYITNQGNRYHSNLNCSGIKRTIYMVRLSDAEGRRGCSRCCIN